MNSQDNETCNTGIRKRPEVIVKAERSVKKSIIFYILLAVSFGTILYFINGESFFDNIPFLITNIIIALVLTLVMAWLFSGNISTTCFEQKAAENIERFLQQHLKVQTETAEKNSEKSPKPLDNAEPSEVS